MSKKSFRFGLEAAGDLLMKLRLEHALLAGESTPYDVFNVVVTAYHLVDWVAKDPSVPAAAKADIASIRDHKYISICQDLANSNKHFEIDLSHPAYQKYPPWWTRRA